MPTKHDATLLSQPQVFLRTLTFNDGTELTLRHNSIVVFTGANNCGKSQVLKDVESCLEESHIYPRIVLTGIECDFCGDIDEPQFLSERFHHDRNGNYMIFTQGLSYSMEKLRSTWLNHSLCNGLHRLFVKRLDTASRLTVSNAVSRDSHADSSPIYKLYQSADLEHKLSNYFRQAFGVDLVVNRSAMATILLHVGEAPDDNTFTIAQQDEYYRLVNALPRLQGQGDGMRSFASILLDTFTSEHTITLIDEPEAFLHPPQARLLGKMLAKHNPDHRQLFISTHSQDFLQGLLDAGNESVTVIRIDRIDAYNKMNVLQNEEIKRLWNNPILRYSDILSGLFHEKVVVCESDYDCLFYQAVMNALYEQKGEVAPDIHFTHCGGKARIKDVVAALRAINVPVIAICDFDLLNDSRVFKAVTASFQLNWKGTLSADMQVIYDSINARESTGEDVWTQLKKVGKHGLWDKAPAAYEKVEKACLAAGLFVVPVGEMECFDKTVGKEKKEWVYHVLENYDLAVEPKLEQARSFVQAVLDYKP